MKGKSLLIILFSKLIIGLEIPDLDEEDMPMI